MGVKFNKDRDFCVFDIFMIDFGCKILLIWIDIMFDFCVFGERFILEWFYFFIL